MFAMEKEEELFVCNKSHARLCVTSREQKSIADKPFDTLGRLKSSSSTYIMELRQSAFASVSQEIHNPTPIILSSIFSSYNKFRVMGFIVWIENIIVWN
jgi:hypothetical protein